MIRTHAPEGNTCTASREDIAGYRVNHSAKAPWWSTLIDGICPDFPIVYWNLVASNWWWSTPVSLRINLKQAGAKIRWVGRIQKINSLFVWTRMMCTVYGRRWTGWSYTVRRQAAMVTLDWKIDAEVVVRKGMAIATTVDNFIMLCHTHGYGKRSINSKAGS